MLGELAWTVRAFSLARLLQSIAGVIAVPALRRRIAGASMSAILAVSAGGVHVTSTQAPNLANYQIPGSTTTLSQRSTMDESSILSKFDSLVESGLVRYDDKQELIEYTDGELKVGIEAAWPILYRQSLF